MAKPVQFKPTPTPIVMAMWEMLGILRPLLLPTGGIHWREYVRSGGPTRHLGRRGAR